MPEPAERGQRYIPGLDGLRAIAVLAVIAYHLNLSWAPGGLLGVGVFFTLSGYLITDLLLTRYDTVGRLDLGQFWLRRARRLLPALVAMLIVVTAWTTVWHPSRLSSLRGGVFAALAYVSNWQLIGQHISYFAQFGPPAPLGHLWSLAIEEQFYLIWPWLLMLGLWLEARRGHDSLLRGRLALYALGLAAVSALLMAQLYHPGFATTRVYDGTDTRAFGLLIGAALAMVWRSRWLRADIPSSARVLLNVVGGLALLKIVLMIYSTAPSAPGMYRGGLVILSVATALVVAATVHPGSSMSRLLGVAPLRWIGVRSYGIYLWHFPVIALTTRTVGAPITIWRAAFQIGLTVALAALSWRYLEKPIMDGALSRLWTMVQPGNVWELGSALRAGPVVAAAAALLVVGTACVGLGTGPTRAAGAATTQAASQPISIHTQDKTSSQRRSHASTPRAQAASTTFCKAVTHLGDSTSEGMVSATFLPRPSQRLAAQYVRVGVDRVNLEISGGTSILETAEPGQPNAYTVARRLVSRGYRGCWVLALGTNDAADIAVGSVENQAERIAKMMSVLGSQPVMWVTVGSLLASGPYAEVNMQKWNAALVRSCAEHPTMRIYDWASVVSKKWFGPDRIHYTTYGYAQRARRIANALITAFPKSSARSPCVVR
ncbi:MAG TPA: acyltransferase family protein [Jatrophihabitantaceae bacterium]|jgi:peptidoglycan/LPS O-acetylase OafA/YrhL/lysophospholipase L1-like esterase|nr:acyltransferase family protein [Jatrophihabitantaceae bacterium]